VSSISARQPTSVDSVCFSWGMVSGMASMMGKAKTKMGELNLKGSHRSFARSNDPMGTITMSVIRTPAPMM
jgi:hypothetical protein